MAPKDTQKYAAEFLGTFLLVLVAGYNVATFSPWGATSIAFTLAAVVYALGPISGGNFNPAVSFALAQQGVLTYQEAVTYMASQAVGGALAGFVIGFGISPEHNMLRTSVGNLANMCVVEYLYTWLLCFVVLNVAASKQLKGNNQFYGFAIGLCVVAGGYAAGGISGGNLNPAVSLGFVVSNFSLSLLELPLFVVFQMAGGFGAVISFHIVRPEEKPDDHGANKYSPAALAHKIEGYFPAKLTAEFLGAAILVLTVGLNVCTKSIGGVWSIAASLMVMIYAVGDVSGAHFNPAVTLAISIVHPETMPYKEAGKYVLAQLAGGGAGAVLYMFILTNVGVDNTLAVNTVWGYSKKQAFISEFFGSFLLVYVVLCVVRPDMKEYVGFAIGACVCGWSAMGKISGGLLNPAVTVGAAAVNLDIVKNSTVVIIFIVAQLLGGAVAAVVFKKVTHVSEFETKAREGTVHGVDSTSFIMVA